MKIQSRFGLATAFLLVLPTFAQAQHAMGGYRAAPSVPVSAGARGGAAGPGTHAASRASWAHVAKPAGSTTADSSAGANGFGFLGSDGLSVQQILNPFPSSGFDFQHLMALNRDANIKALIDPATQAKLAIAERRRH